MPRGVDKADQYGEGCRRDDRQLAAVAARQHGVVSRAQLYALGYGEAAIRYRVRVGRLHRLLPGVFAIGHSQFTWRARLAAATLSCGEGAVVSHRTAAALLGLLDSARRPVDVSVDGAGPRGRPGVALHRRQSLRPRDGTVVDGIRVTSVARTLRDLAAVVAGRRLERAFDEAERRRLLDLPALEDVQTRRQACPGARAFAGLLGQIREQPWTRSELEERFLELCGGAGLPPPVVNGSLLGFEVDFHWPSRGLIVEVDGFDFHRTRASFERDRARDARLQVAGHRVLRVTQRRLEIEPWEAIDDVAALLRRPQPEALQPPGRPP